MSEQMRTYDLILAAARLRQKSVKAADYTSLLAADNALATGDAFIFKFGDDWLVSTNTGYSIKVKRRLVKPLVARMLDRFASAEVPTYHLPIIDKPWDETLMQEVANRVRSMPVPISAAATGKLLESVEALA